jgi:gamma-glutamyltranspeptidase/glutathione hydrolase
VVAPHYLASEAGAEILRRGGNAADAVIAADAVLGVVYPHMCGIGGDGFVLVEPGQSGPIECLNATGWSSELANATDLRRRGLERMPLHGGLAVTVPGIVDGWGKLAERFGRLPLSELLEPAIHHADEGYPVTARLSRWIEVSRDVLGQDPWLAQHFLPDDKPPREGALVRLPDLARTLALLAEKGARTFYEGEIAKGVVDAVSLTGGIMTMDDLFEFAAEWDSPIMYGAPDFTIAVPGPNSQGITLPWMLCDMERATLSGSPSISAALLRAKLKAFRLRDRVVTDPRDMTVPVTGLLELREPCGKEIYSQPTLPAGGTVFLAAWDRDGTLVSMIQSIYYDFGSGVVVPGRGIILQNRGAYFSLADRDLNVLRPRKRTLHTLMCALITDHRRGERVALGTMGGDAQPQVLAQVIMHWRSGLSWEQALRMPRWVHGRIAVGETTESIRYETGLDGAVIDALAAHGEMVPLGPWDESFGHCHVISVRDGVAFGATDPRSDGQVATL